jgi:hypothetical protein
LIGLSIESARRHRSMLRWLALVLVLVLAICGQAWFLTPVFADGGDHSAAHLNQAPQPPVGSGPPITPPGAAQAQQPSTPLIPPASVPLPAVSSAPPPAHSVQPASDVSSRAAAPDAPIVPHAESSNRQVIDQPAIPPSAPQHLDSKPPAAPEPPPVAETVQTAPITPSAPATPQHAAHAAPEQPNVPVLHSTLPASNGAGSARHGAASSEDRSNPHQQPSNPNQAAPVTAAAESGTETLNQPATVAPASSQANAGILVEQSSGQLTNLVAAPQPLQATYAVVAPQISGTTVVLPRPGGSVDRRGPVADFVLAPSNPNGSASAAPLSLSGTAPDTSENAPGAGVSGGDPAVAPAQARLPVPAGPPGRPADTRAGFSAVSRGPGANTVRRPANAPSISGAQRGVGGNSGLANVTVVGVHTPEKLGQPDVWAAGQLPEPDVPFLPSFGSISVTVPVAVPAAPAGSGGSLGSSGGGASAVAWLSLLLLLPPAFFGVRLRLPTLAGPLSPIYAPPTPPG